jgi:hypothetical protein
MHVVGPKKDLVCSACGAHVTQDEAFETIGKALEEVLAKAGFKIERA